MNKLICTVGLPRSGKSTWARSTGLPIVNPDSIRLALHGQRFFGPAEPMVWAIAHLMVDALFRAGHEVVILDATNVQEKRRQEWARGPYRQEFKLIDTSREVCLARAAAENDTEIIPVIKRMAAQWDYPAMFAKDAEIAAPARTEEGERCEECGGSGKVGTSTPNSEGGEDYEACPRCGGSGRAKS